MILYINFNKIKFYAKKSRFKNIDINREYNSFKLKRIFYNSRR